jgi:hypothetical protein
LSLEHVSIVNFGFYYCNALAYFAEWQITQRKSFVSKVPDDVEVLDVGVDQVVELPFPEYVVVAVVDQGSTSTVRIDGFG